MSDRRQFGYNARVYYQKFFSIDTVMDKIAANYEKENDESISKTISIIEPTIVAVFAVAVGLILLSVMLPLLSVMTGMM